MGGDGETERRRKGEREQGGYLRVYQKEEESNHTLQNIFLINYEKKPGQKEAQQQQAAIELSKDILTTTHFTK